MTSVVVRRFAAAILAAAALGAAGISGDAKGPGWLRVDYGSLVDGRRLSHSGEPVGLLLKRLGGRALPPAGERREDALSYRLLDPLLEPYAFVLIDALDSQAAAPGPPMLEVGSLWDPGEAQPAWVELLRARKYVVESDGLGRIRAFLPSSALDSLPPEAVPESSDPVEAAKAAWTEGWPVLRHALAAERRRLAHGTGGAPPALDVEVHAYRHVLARGVFDVGLLFWRTSVTDTGPRRERPAVDLAGLKAILDRGGRIEGARLEPSGRLRWFTSESETKPTILGRPVTLADLAVAYRAVVRGGYGEPYMSLDRATAPQVAVVNYGGRLRDTSLGMVSLLADVRFKTFSVGVDLLGPGDVRDALRAAVPGFATHLERFASNPAAGAVLNQQTRFWFYPDDVDLTLSAEGDVLAFRKVRMTAASERVREAGSTAEDPPWTKDTVSFVNAHYDALAARFPEMADLDESVRLLSLFTWLAAAEARGLNVPDLDALLALELPALPTPRRFPQLLTHDVLPPPGAAGIVDALDRTEVGDALDRLEPKSATPLPAQRRLERDRAMLSGQVPDQAAMAAEIDALPAGASAYEEDLLSYRAERLLMHARVLAAIPPERRASVEARRKEAPRTRVFSAGIGGVDLGMNAVLARAAGRAGKLGIAAGGNPAPARDAAPGAAAAAAPPAGPVVDPPELPPTEWPDHGFGRESERATTALPEGTGTIAERRLPGSLVRTGSFKSKSGAVISWDEIVLGMEGPEVRARHRIREGGASAPTFARLEDGRFISYRFERAGSTLRAVPAVAVVPDEASAALPRPAPGPEVPAGLATMDLLPAEPPAAPTDRSEPSTLRMRLSTGGHERIADMPRALLQRLVRGREIDLTPDKPLQAFTPSAQMLGDARTLMVVQSKEESREPWSGPAAVRPGEEDAVRLAAALTRWWAPESSNPPHAVVGTDPAASPARWTAAPKLDGTIAVQATDELMPSQIAPGAAVLLVVSAEPPGVLGKRLRVLANDPALRGKAIAVASLGGPMREDLPASLLRNGKLGALGVLECGPVGRRAALQALGAFARGATSDAAKGRRPDELTGPFTWFY